MASLIKLPDSYHVAFRVGGKQFKRSLKTLDKKDASANLKRIEATIHEIETGKLPLPEGCDSGLFVMSDGKLTGKVVAPVNTTLGDLTTRYVAEKIGLEKNTMVTTGVHIKHLLKFFGVRQIVAAITHADLQRYVVARSKEVKAGTIGKELGTLSALWSWGVKNQLFVGVLPVKGLEFDKTSEPEPFATFAEIEERIKRNKLTGKQADAEWDRLWLTIPEVNEFLNHVLKVGQESYLHPLMSFVAHTGARRSEAERSQVEDFDFANGVVRVREMKKKKGKVTYRHVPMSTALRAVMGDYLPTVQGGSTFGVSVKVMWLRFQELTCNSKWKVLKGFHIFRHSMASNLARMGTPDRMIDAVLGHVTEEMRKRYQHLHPTDKQNLMTQMFALSA